MATHLIRLNPLLCKACDNVTSDYKQHFFDQSNSLASELVKCAANKLPLVQVQAFMEKHFRIEFRCGFS